MGSSAGGHLAGLVSTYTDPIDFEDLDEVDREDPIPDATILCYAVCHMPDDTGIAHVGSFVNLLGDRKDYEHFSNDLNVTDKTPPAFLWHTSDDEGVNVINSYLYATALREHNIPHELHVFPHGYHGLGLAESNPHVAQWAGLMANWLCSLGWL
jgi:acetyl esterase/lipase